MIPWVLPPEQGSLGRSVALQLLMGRGGSERALWLGLQFRNKWVLLGEGGRLNRDIGWIWLSSFVSFFKQGLEVDKNVQGDTL